MSSPGAGAVRPRENFPATVDAHWLPVFRLLWSLSADPHECEDLTQETFVRALQRWETYPPGSSLRIWLLRIATNAFFDARRKTQTISVSPLSEDIFGDEKTADDIAVLAEPTELIRLAVRELADLTRLVFHLRVTEELPFREIAEIAGTTEAAARQHMHQARARLLRRFGDQLRKRRS